VAKGETLYRISKDYGVSVQDLKEWNRLADNTIHVGQKLIVSSP
jgi:membrane-bound lytic murein transglycosylase D